MGCVVLEWLSKERRLWNKTTYQVRYYISSLSSDAKVLGQAVLRNWGIENSLHWGGVSAGEASTAVPPLLDVTNACDASRIRNKDNAPQNFSLLRHLAVNLLTQEKTVRSSIAQKRYRAALDNDYLAKVVAG